jgi:UDP-N-acetylmuramoylalanine-D-glutamate ligase
VVYVVLVGSKHKNESLFQNLVANIIEVQTLRGIILLGGDFNACTATHQIPLTLATFVNYYRRMSSLRLSNQVLWLNDKTATPMLAVEAASS